MSNPVTFHETVSYLAYRQMGLSVRESAHRIGRAPSTMRKFDQTLKPAVVNSEVERLFLDASEAVAARVLPPGVSASAFFELDPDLMAKVRSLAKGVQRAADRLGVRVRSVGIA